jgi:hypothetical protein
MRAERVKLFGGFQGMEPFHSGDIEAEYVVLGSPREVALWALRRAVEQALNREKRAYGIDRGDGWSLSALWEYPARRADEAQRIEAEIWGRCRRRVGRVTLVWPSEEALGGRA